MPFRIVIDNILVVLGQEARMKYKKSVISALMVALVVMSTSAFAATYDVEDKKAQELLNEIKGQVGIIVEMLDVVKEKEKSLDLMDKAATERTNDSMTKLSLNEEMSFVSENPNGIDFGSLLSGNGNFLEKFTQDLAKDGINLKQFAKNSPIVSSDLGSFILKFDGITTGANYEGLTDAESIKAVYLQNIQELSAEESKIEAEERDFDAKKKEIDDKDEKRLEDTAKASDSKSESRQNLWNELASSKDILGVVNGIGSGRFDYGSVLSSDSLQTIFMKEGTESTTAAQERTTSVESIRASKEMRDAEAKAFHAEARIKKDNLNLMFNINDTHFQIAMGKAMKFNIESVPVPRQLEKYESGFKKYRKKD